MKLNEGYQIKNLKFKSLEDIMDYLYENRIIKSNSLATRKKIKNALISLKKTAKVHVNGTTISRVK